MYAIRFEPLTLADGLDPARVCAAYLSTDGPTVSKLGLSVLTTTADDVRILATEQDALWVAGYGHVIRRCMVDRLRPVVVPLEEALADLAD
jgi:hypothetical protein